MRLPAVDYPEVLPLLKGIDSLQRLLHGLTGFEFADIE